MKTIGLIGGTGWISTIEYYRAINQGVNEKMGGSNTAKLLLYSVNFAEFKPTEATDWEATAKRLSAIAQKLERAGADCLLLCANTMHLMADTVKASIQIPLIHIVEETAKAIKNKNIDKVALLGTRFTMEKPFFKERLAASGVTPMIPDPEDRDFIHSSIFSELEKGIFNPQTKERYIRIIEKLVGRGAGGVILGCTEIPLLINQADCSVPAFDTGAIHAHAAVAFATTDHLIKEKINEQ
jgi:aspartate racemase